MSETAGEDHGYEAASAAFIAHRKNSTIGVATTADWAAQLPPGGRVLDLGCGSGVPITRVLVDAGLSIHAVDASPAMAAAFRERYPHIPLECASAVHSSFFNLSFDGILAWGLIFLLPADEQATLIRKMARALKPGGRLMFTAPAQKCTWKDVLTGEESMSLGRDAYRALLEAENLKVVGEAEDEGDNHYYFAQPALQVRSLAQMP
ncbi:MAG TPA: class I SAM-dependent methyltransferase [Longimicrobiales bacterium]